MNNVEADKLLDKMLAKQTKENLAAAKKPCNEERAKAEAAYLKKWARKRPIIKVGGEESTFWKCGKFMTKIEPGVVTGMVKHCLAVRINDRLTFL